MLHSSEASAQLIGTWKLISFQVQVEGNAERHDVYNRASGFLILSEDRMTALLTAGDREPADAPSVLFDGMMAYSGPYRLDGDSLITTVDCAWHPGWLGTEQMRYVSLDGHRLSLTSPFQQHPKFPGEQVRGIVTWERE